jgi:N-glycosylase/DNA lyase
LNGEKIDWEVEYQQHVMKGVNAFRTYVESWYDGTLHTIFFAKNQREEIRQKICSILAGYVWDETNEYVTDSDKAVKNLARLIKVQEKLEA